MAVGTYYVRTYGIYTVLVPVEAVSETEALGEVVGGRDGDWTAYAPLFEARVSPKQFAVLGLSPAAFGPLTARPVPPRFQTTFQALVHQVRELSDAEWQVLLAERLLCRPLEGL